MRQILVKYVNRALLNSRRVINVTVVFLIKVSLVLGKLKGGASLQRRSEPTAAHDALRCICSTISVHKALRLIAISKFLWGDDIQGKLAKGLPKMDEFKHRWPLGPGKRNIQTRLTPVDALVPQLRVLMRQSIAQRLQANGVRGLARAIFYPCVPLE